MRCLLQILHLFILLVEIACNYCCIVTRVEVDDNCIVCLETLKNLCDSPPTEMIPVRQSYCELHTAHLLCMLKWYRQWRNCPTCRKLDNSFYSLFLIDAIKIAIKTSNINIIEIINLTYEIGGEEVKKNIETMGILHNGGIGVAAVEKLINSEGLNEHLRSIFLEKYSLIKERGHALINTIKENMERISKKQAAGYSLGILLGEIDEHYLRSMTNEDMLVVYNLAKEETDISTPCRSILISIIFSCSRTHPPPLLFDVSCMKYIENILDCTHNEEMYDVISCYPRRPKDDCMLLLLNKRIRNKDPADLDGFMKYFLGYPLDSEDTIVSILHGLGEYKNYENTEKMGKVVEKWVVRLMDTVDIDFSTGKMFSLVDVFCLHFRGLPLKYPLLFRNVISGITEPSTFLEILGYVYEKRVTYFIEGLYETLPEKLWNINIILTLIIFNRGRRGHAFYLFRLWLRKGCITPDNSNEIIRVVFRYRFINLFKRAIREVTKDLRGPSAQFLKQLLEA